MRVRSRFVGSCMMGLGLVAAGCTTTPTGPPPPAACPSYRGTVLSTSDQSHYAVPLAVSADGGSLVTSESVSGQVQLSIRPTGSTGPVRFVATLPTYWESSLVGVATGGTQVVFQGAGQFIQRWLAANGAVSDVEPPTVASPPPGVAAPAVPISVSPDGRRIVWRQDFGSGPTGSSVYTTTDAATDEVLAQGPDWLPGSSGLPDLDAAVDAVQAVYAGELFGPSAIAVSDSGRYVAVKLWTGPTGRTDNIAVFDRQTSAVTPVLLDHPDGMSGGAYVQHVTDGGDVLIVKNTATDQLVVRIQLGGAERVVSPVASGGMGYADAASADLRAVVVTRTSLTGFELVSERCT